MGVVWEAVDQKLGRSVAVKFLTEASRDNSAALERFWREARAASALNHPGICTIHELNESDETPFIVMELLEGSSLEKLYRGRTMPYQKLLELGVQLSDALDAAHRKGILHRDIKPANIFITNSDQAKLLDFGLAKIDSAIEGNEGGGLDADAPTEVNALTSLGSSVGTIAYMSPEQARGETLDARSDLFSLGIVLYEMSTGQHPFSGNTTAVVFDHILNRAPVAAISLNAQLPVEFENILDKTLEKDKDLRCQTAAELRADLKRLQRKGSSGSVSNFIVSGEAGSPVPESRASNPARGVSDTDASRGQAPPGSVRAPAANKSRSFFVGATAVVLLAAAGIAAWRLWPRPRPFASVTVRQITNIGTIENIALSTDGKFLAEVKDDKQDQRTLWLRNTATNTDTQILGAFGGAYSGLTFSPDANYLYFVREVPGDYSESALYVTSVFGGTPKQLIRNIDTPISFSPDGSRFTYVRWTRDRKDQYSEVHLADKDGGNDQVLHTTMDIISPPVWSPDGSRIAWTGFIVGGLRSFLGWIDIASKKTGSVAAPQNFIFAASDSHTDLVWLPDNRHLLVTYYQPHTDRAQIGSITMPTGEMRAVTNDVNSYNQLALSGDGRTLATILTSFDSSVSYYKGDGGSPILTTPLRVLPQAIAWSGEDRLLYINARVAIGEIDRASGSIKDFDVGEMELGGWLTTCPNNGDILFTAAPKASGQFHLFKMNSNGENLMQVPTQGPARAPLCAADGREIYYSTAKGLRASLWSVTLADGASRKVAPTFDFDKYAFLSWDETLAATIEYRDKKAQITITDLATGRPLRSIPQDMTDGGGYPLFSPDGRGVAYPATSKGGHTLLYQAIDGSDPRPMIAPAAEVVYTYAWSPSGKQLAVTRWKVSSDVVLITDQKGK
jgi:eukaryotic-like serine/threonine-protein kinase